jgi:ribosome biogenesis GTPase
VQLWASPEALDASFADVTELASGCRYRDCTHGAEPGCAVRDALAPERLASFHKLQRELHHLARQTDIHVAQEEKRRWKTIHKAMRNVDKRK